MIIRHNMMAMNANRQLNITNKKKAKTTERLSSGYKINRAADDAAGLAISEKMRRLVRGLNQAAQNVQEGVGYIQVADGALNEVHDILHRMNELAIKSANGTNQDDDREYLDSEVQQLKKELDRIFDTTSFNDKIIWEPDPNLRQQIGTEKRQAVKFLSTTGNIDITNDNCGVLPAPPAATTAYAPSGYYEITATEADGVKLSWTGYDGNDYETTYIDWTTLKNNQYSFEMSDYFGGSTVAPNLYDSTGQPVFKHKISFAPEETATIADIVTCIDGCILQAYNSVQMSGRFEDGNSSNVMSVNTVQLSYPAAFASNHNTGTTGTTNVHDFDNADDTFLEAADQSGNILTNGSSTGNLTSFPSATTVSAAQSSSDGWAFSFYMDGIGSVTASSSSIRYWGNDTDDDDYGADKWWQWSYQYINGNRVPYRKTAVAHSSSGTLGGLMDTLVGDKGTSTPGLLHKDNGGDCDTGGTIEIIFSITANQPYTYGDGLTSQNVGSFRLSFDVSSNDTEATVLDKINKSLNSQTILDFYSTSSGNDNGHFYNPTANTHMIDVPIYGGGCELIIQAGTEADDKIHILYDSLSTIELGLTNTNVLSQNACNSAITTIDEALQTVSAQRAVFGAYQNRLEHAYNNNKNIEENTQAAESQIRDTDMALTMVEHSNLDILQQAGQAMLAQTNTTQQAVLHLLQNI